MSLNNNNWDQLPFEVRERIDKVCDGFRELLHKKQNPRIEDFLAAHPDLDADALFCELLHEEVSWRHQNHETISPEEFGRRFSDKADLIRKIFQGAELTVDESKGDAASASSSIGAKNGLRFRILKPHRRGGLGEVFVAEDQELHRKVAVKEIREKYADNPDARGRFVLEAEITGQLEHPGIVAVYSLGQYDNGRPFYAMRFIKGEDLKDAIERFYKAENAGRDPGERALAFRDLLGRFVDACNAVAYAHSRGILHRDLKPGNIRLGEYGETLVVDWGLAVAVNLPDQPVDTTEPALTPIRLHKSASARQMGSAVGTPAFMSPEQAAGQLDQLSPASDIYSLGATLYVLLTGQVPLKDPNVKELLRKVQQGDVVAPRKVKANVPAPLDAICRKAMALRPQDRYPSAKALAADVEHWLADEPVSAWPEPLAVKAGRWMRRNKALVSGVAAAFLVSLIALTAWAIWDERQQSEAARKEALVQTETARKEALVQVETARKQALAEKKVSESLSQAQHTRTGLHKILKKPGGVQELLNQPAHWQGLINSARADWQRSSDHADGALGPQWAGLLKTLDDDLKSDHADYELALRLEKIRLDTAVVSEGKFDYVQAERNYPMAFEQAGLAIAANRQKEVALLVGQSPIKDQLLAALDHWAWIAYQHSKPDLCNHLLEVARLADPDPWRDRVRDRALWENLQAVQQLAREVRRDPDLVVRLSPQMLHLLAHCVAPAEKESWLRMSQSFHPADFWLNFQLAFCLQQKNETLEAAGFYRVALAIRPNNTGVYNNLGCALRDAKDLPGAIDALRKAVASEPNNASAWNNLGVALRAQKDLPAAIAAYKKALAINPKSAKAWSNLGNAALDTKDLPAAIDAHRKALDIDADFVNGWINLGNALRASKDLLAAIDAYKKALDIDPNNTVAWYNLGIALGDKKDLPAAIDAYKKALDINPKFVGAWRNLGNALCDKDLPAAINAYKKALDIDPNNTMLWNSLAVALSGKQDWPAAIGAYKKALDSDPKNAMAWNNLGLALRKMNHLPAAELLALADLCQRYKKRPADATELYTKAFADDPGTAQDLTKNYRYKAACSAALAAADAQEAEDQVRLRKQALGWLQADLAARAGLLHKDRLLAAAVHDAVQQWQRNADLASVRDAKELAKLGADERDAFTKLWAEVGQLVKQARSSYTQTEHKGRLSEKQREQGYPITVIAGNRYVIDMESVHFNASLRLQDDQGKVVAEKDTSPASQNSRIVFTPKKQGTYRIIATSLQQQGIGVYTLRIREVMGKERP